MLLIMLRTRTWHHLEAVGFLHQETEIFFWTVLKDSLSKNWILKRYTRIVAQMATQKIVCLLVQM